jgi:beta-glucanase (GH16 family)
MRYWSILFVWVLLLLIFCCQSDNDTGALPFVTLEGASVYRQPIDMDFEFKISIPHPSTFDVLIDYKTKDGTALAGIDFISTSGTAIIPAGSKTADIKVSIKADSLRRDVQFFYLELFNPRHCTLVNQEVMARIENDGLYLPIDNTGYDGPSSHPNYTLIWSDEFNGESVDENNWLFDLGLGINGWGTHELGYYTNRTKNAFVSCGNLIIEARKENFEEGATFTSARLTTRGKRSFQYGRIDIRAKVPFNQGIMPSLLMQGSNIGTVGWPACGEIDIMQLPHTENYVYNTLHWSDSKAAPHQFGFNQPLDVLPENTFHVFSVEWNANQITMYIDNNPSFSMSTSGGSFPFDNNFYFIFNLAVGGDWPGAPDGTTQFPQRMAVDYVRVFQ